MENIWSNIKPSEVKKLTDFHNRYSQNNDNQNIPLDDSQDERYRLCQNCGQLLPDCECEEN